MISFTFCGVPFGTVLANFLSGIIAVKFGWPSIFYISGVLGIFWYLLWIFFVKKSPEHDPMISEEEKDFIMSNITTSYTKGATPWKEIFSSVPVWAISITVCFYNWGFYTFITFLPTYLKGLFEKLCILYYTSSNLTQVFPQNFRNFEFPVRVVRLYFSFAIFSIWNWNNSIGNICRLD